MADISRPVPVQSQPFVDVQTGIINTDWLNFLITLFQRTGGSAGKDITVVKAQADLALATANTAVINAAAAQAAANAASASAALRLLKSANLSDVASVNSARGNLNIGPAQGPWVDPTGAGSRATFDMDLPLPVSVAYVQAEVLAIANQVRVLQKAVGQLVLDELAAKTLTH